MEAGFVSDVEVGQYFMTKDIGGFRRFRSVACGEYTLPRDDPASQPKEWIQGNMRIRLVFEVTTSYMCGSRQISILGQNILWNKQIRDRFKPQQYRNSCRSTRISSVTIKVSRLLQPDQRQKQNHKKENLLIQQLPYRYTKENGLILNHQNKLSLCTISRRKSSVFFDTIKQYSENKMEQLNSKELNSIFEIILHKYSTGLMIVGKLVWQQEEVQKEDINFALFIQEQFCTSVLFRDTLDVISLIPITGQCNNSAWIIPSHLTHWMCIQSSLYYQQWIDTWRSRFKQKTNSILLAH